MPKLLVQPKLKALQFNIEILEILKSMFHDQPNMNTRFSF